VDLDLLRDDRGVEILVGGTMLAHEIVEQYLDALLEVPEIWNKFPSSPAWGPEVIRALVTAGLQAFPSPALDAGYRDTSQRSESLALDVCIADPGSWGPPCYIAEHVSAPRRASIQHSAWKLLATRTERRVLVTYAGAKSDVRDHAAIESAVRDVCVANPGKSAPNDIVLISADINARPSSAKELREIFAHSIVGKMA
jgi:hypothetical protein